MRYAIPTLLLALAAPAVADEPKVPNLALESYKLPNGLKVALHRDPAVPRVVVCVAYHVGSKDESAGRTGFAHFFEHMMFRGTKNNPNYDVPLQETGAQSNAFTSEDMTVYYEVVPANFLERALYLEAERLAFLPSALDQSKFDLEREVVKNERRQSYENQPYGLAEEAILAALFPKGHPYSWSVIGSMRDLDAATLDDLKRFFAEFYQPGNATLTLAGDFDPAQAKALIARYFAPLSGSMVAPKVATPKYKVAPRSIRQADKVQLPRLYLDWPSVADADPDAPALDLLATILSGGDASRLRRSLVLEGQLAKDVAADQDGKESAGFFQIRATAAQGKSIEEIQTAIDAQVAELRAKPPAPTELARALAFFEKSNYDALAEPLARAIVLGTGFAQHDDPEYYKKDIARYFRVTPADIRRVAATYLTADRVRLVVEPAKPDEPKTVAVPVGPDPGAESAKIAERTPGPGPDWKTLPGPSAAPGFRAPKVQRARLADGLELWMVPWRTLPVVDCRLIVRAGSADDPASKAGRSALLAEVLDKGTASKTTNELAEALGALGVTPTVDAGVEDTTIAFASLSRNLPKTLDLVADMILHPRFDPADVDRERNLLLAALKTGPDRPMWSAGRAFRALMYGKDNPFGIPAQGYPETVKSLGVDDLKSLYSSRFVPNNAALIVVGDIDPATLVPLLEKTLGAWKSSPKTPAAPTSGALPRPDASVVYLVDKPGAVQSILMVGRPWVGRDDARYDETLIGNRVLGADFLSRLNQNLREKNGYSYGAGSRFAYRRGGGTWQATSQVRGDATAPALKEMLAELDGVGGARPLSPVEVATAKDGEARSYPEGFASPRGIAGAIAELVELNLPPEELDAALGRIESVGPEAVNAVMTRLGEKSGRLILVVGDRASVEPKLKELGFKAIRVVSPDGVPVE